MAAKRRKEHEGGKKRRGSSQCRIKDDPNEMNRARAGRPTPRAWCGGHDDDMLHEMALAEQKGLAKPSPLTGTRRREEGSTLTLRELWSMALQRLRYH